MTAAQASAAPAATGTQRKPWTSRRSDEVLLQVYRVIANAGRKGCSPTEVRRRLSGLDDDAIKLHLHELNRKGHVRHIGVKQYGYWVATSKCLPGEPEPLWLQETPDSDDAPPADHNDHDRAEAVLQQARKVPASVFSLGPVAISGFGVDIDAIHMRAARTAALAQPIAAPSLPPPAAEAAPSPAPSPAPAAEPAARFSFAAPAATVERAPAAPPALPLPTLPGVDCTDGITPRFSLCSHGTFTVDLCDERFLILTAEETRALFRYLDRLMAIGHGSLSEATL